MGQPLQSDFSQSGPAAPPAGSRISSAARPIDATTLDLLGAWQQEDATADPLQLQAAEQELIEFMKAVNDARKVSGEPLLYP